MKKLFYIFLVVCGFSLSANAQKSSGQTANENQNQIVIAIQSCEELNTQLTNLFGENYSLSNQKVIAQLEKNIADTYASPCTRKSSLYAVYGENYVSKLHLINIENKIQTKTNK